MKTHQHILNLALCYLNILFFFIFSSTSGSRRQTTRCVTSAFSCILLHRKLIPHNNMSSLYGFREEENSQRFNQLADTLNQFRNTVENDIQGGLRTEQNLLDSLNDNFSQLWTRVKRTSTDLSAVIKRNSNLSRIVGLILAAFFVAWMLYKLHSY